MKIAIIGSGGREHAIAWKFAQTEGWENVFTLPGNGGIPNSHDLDVSNFHSLHEFCVENGIDLIFVGPEAHLAAGIVDYFRANSQIQIFGPSQAATQLESSKAFAKEFMLKHNVATADFQKFTSPAKGIKYAMPRNGNIVIKYDGLAAGKGVYVCQDMQEVELALAELQEKYGDEFPFIIEERLIGDEISIIGFTDGKFVQLLQPSQDHKQLLDGDKGPNTGGMGAISPVPFCDDELMQQIRSTVIDPTIKGLSEEGFDYKGVIYFGLMITENGPKLLEYNARLGDPETEVILPALKSSLTELVLATLNNKLAVIELEFQKGYFVDVVLVSGGYPKSYTKGYPISGLENIAEDSLVFHAGTQKVDDQILTNGGRVLNVVAQADTLKQAIEKAYNECIKISFEKRFYRNDIGQRNYVVIAK